MKKIKILITINNFDTSWSGKVLLDIASSLDRKIFEPEICVGRKGGQLFEVVEKTGIRIHQFNFKTNYHPLITLPYRIFRISKFFRKNKIDIVHSWNWSSDFTEALAAKLAGVKYVYTKKNMSWGSKSWRIKTSLADKIPAINHTMISKFFHNSSKAELLPLGLDTEFYNPQLFDSKHNTDDFTVISVVNLIPVKGIEFLIDAIQLLSNSKYEFKLVIVGNNENDYGKFLKDKVKKAKLDDKIKFTGKVLDVRSALMKADLFVIPTKDLGEGMPMAPVEAMAMENIVIGSDVPGVNYVLKDFPELLFKAGSAEAIAEKILFIYNMPAEKQIMLKRQMRSKVVADFNINLFKQSHERIYKQLVKRS